MYVLKVSEEYFLCGDHGFKAISKFEYTQWIKRGKDTWTKEALIQVELSKFVFETLWANDFYRSKFETKLHAFYSTCHIHESHVEIKDIPLGQEGESFDMILPLAQSRFWCSSVVECLYPFLPPVGFYVHKKFEAFIKEVKRVGTFCIVDTTLDIPYYPGRMAAYHNGDYKWVEFKMNGLTWEYDFQNPAGQDNLNRYMKTLYRKLVHMKEK